MKDGPIETIYNQQKILLGVARILRMAFVFCPYSLFLVEPGKTVILWMIAFSFLGLIVSYLVIRRVKKHLKNRIRFLELELQCYEQEKDSCKRISADLELEGEGLIQLFQEIKSLERRIEETENWIRKFRRLLWGPLSGIARLRLSWPSFFYYEKLSSVMLVLSFLVICSRLEMMFAELITLFFGVEWLPADLITSFSGWQCFCQQKKTVLYEEKLRG